MVKRFWQEYFIGDAVSHTGSHRGHIISSPIAGTQSTYHSKTGGFTIVVRFSLLLGSMTWSHSHTSITSTGFSSVQFSHSAMSNSLRPHGLQHARLPCPSPAHGACSNSCPWSWWCHPNHFTLCHPLLLPPSIFPSIRVFSHESVLH